MNSDDLKYILHQFSERKLPTPFQREIKIPQNTGKIIGLTGPRRCGKTFLFFDLIQQLINEGVSRENIVYLNFEDDRLYPFKEGDFDLILRSLRELFPKTASTKIYLFLDEVQSAPGWERWVRRLQDTEEIEIFVTGSSSKLLTKDLSTALRGRSITLEVFPLSFKEYLSFKKASPIANNAKQESHLRNHFRKYLEIGGFPEIVLAEESLRPFILEEYSSLMLYRDLVERYSIRNESLMKDLLRFVFRNTATLVNQSKLYRDFSSMGHSLGRNTIFEYISYLEDAFLIFMLTKQETSTRKQAHNPKKIHIIDPGLTNAFKTKPELDLGHRLETIIFLHHRRTQKNLHYYIDDLEIDLCNEAGSFFVNSCWDLNELKTGERENRSYQFAQKKYPKAKGLIVYHEFSMALQKKSYAIPAWKYLLRSETT